ncbi:hypothetical protein ACHWQZ_G016366 [Mnemiopsis leidyi]
MSGTREHYTPEGRGELLSVGKPTAQSDTAWFGYSWRAVDNNTGVHYWNSTCTHNDFFNEQLTETVSDWWRVDLLDPYEITSIVVYNRIGQPMKLNGTHVKVDGLPCKDSLITVSENDTELEDMEITLECRRVGRVVSFEISPSPQGSVILTLCEVQVFGFTYSEEDNSPAKNTIKWDLESNGLLLVSGADFDKGIVCDSWMNMSNSALDLICHKLNFDRVYSFWTTSPNKTSTMIYNIDHINCSNDANDISDCDFVGWKNNTYCIASDALHIKCANDTNRKETDTKCETVEINEGGFLKEKCKTEVDKRFYKCPFENKYFEIKRKFLCNEDESFINDTTEYCYNLTKTCGFSNTQMCGIDGQKLENGRCMVICPTELGKSIALPSKYICNGDNDCLNGADEANCDLKGSERCVLDSSIVIPKEIVEKVTCDESYHSCGGGYFFVDENITNCDHKTGKYVTHSKPSSIENWWLHPAFTCDPDFHNYWSQEGCEDPGIETGRELGPNEGIRCPSAKDASQRIYVPPFNMCTNPRYADDSTKEYQPCLNWEDQMNCQEAKKNVALYCKVKNKSTPISKYLICARGTSCDDGMDQKCKNFTTANGEICEIHRHRICDEKEDCAFGIDETSCHTKLFQKVSCHRRVSFSKSLPVLKELVMDGVKDCLNGEDESPDFFHKCGKEGTDRFRYEIQANKCNEMFKISKITEDKRYLSMDNLCDHASDFSEEKTMCYISRQYVNVWKKILSHYDKLYLPPCLPNERRYSDNLFQCTQKNVDVIGSDTSLNFVYSKTKKECSFLYGEAYLFASCNNLCIEKDAKCMNQNHLATECVNNNTDFKIINTLKRERSTKNIQIVKASFRKIQHGSGQVLNLVTNIFSCRNGRCIKKEKVCNLVDDCGDGSDEDDCVNQFRCEISRERLTLEKRCNGIVNCVDFSDECGEVCVNTQRRIISSSHLRNAAWIIGMGSTLINILVLLKSGLKLARMRDVSVVFRDNFLIMLIAFGDLLVGAYLLVIAIADYFKGDEYCEDQFNWRGGLECLYLGIISSIGSQISLFTMTALSLYRVHRIRHLFQSSILSRKRLIISVLVCLLIIIMSVLISVIPVMTQLEDFFINGLSYEGITLFVGMINKPVHVNVIKQYQGQMRIQYKDGLPTMSWKTIRMFIAGMFSKDHGGVEGKGTGFYGNSGVCLFKYFVTDDDPQRIYSMSILFLNFFCFVIITVSYVIVLIVSRSNSNTRQVAQMNTALQRKISLIILSDACCWIPFIAIGVLHFARQIDASPLYDFCSIVVLPVNSLINPIIYHSEFNEWFRLTSNFLSSMKGKISRSLQSTKFSLSSSIGARKADGPSVPAPKKVETSFEVTNKTTRSESFADEESSRAERISLKTFMIKQTSNLEIHEESVDDNDICKESD